MNKITIEISEKIKNLYLSHVSIKDISNETGISRERITRHLKEIHIYRKFGAKYIQNDDFFSIIDTEKKAYWLGVLYADGCVRNPNIVVFSSIDKNWVELFKRDIETDRPIRREFHKTFQREIWKISITSEQMYNDLCNHGCVDRKSKIIRMPNIPENLIRHFIRGYFDGDGSVCFYFATKTHKHRTLATSFTSGSQGFLEDICNIIPTSHIQKVYWHSNGTGGGVWSVRIGPNDSLILYDYFYKDSTVWLQRKKNVFELYRNVRYILKEWNQYTDDEQVFILQHAKETLRDYNRLPDRVKG